MTITSIKLCNFTVEQLRAENAALREPLAAAQAMIAKMREALENYKIICQDHDLPHHYKDAMKALATPTNQDALHEARALECERLANTHGVGVMKWLFEEAADHRSRKEGK